MPKFVIEREIPGAGKLITAELQGISAHSLTALDISHTLVESLFAVQVMAVVATSLTSNRPTSSSCQPAHARF